MSVLARPGVRTALAVLSVIAAIAVTLAAYGPTPITIDGALVVVPRGTTVRGLEASGSYGARGALLSLHGKVLEANGGGAPRLSTLGPGKGEGEPLPAGARLVSAPGVDIVEVGQHITTETAPPVRYVGAGPFESIESSGTPGRAAVIVGAVSGEEISRFPISAGTPMTIRREPAYAGAKEVALTFDDGPWHDSTDAVLRILNGSGIRATFFMTGSQLRNRPITARRVLAAGMEVGTHSNTHKLLAHAKHALIRAEIVRGARQMVRTLGIGPLWYRPAGGSVNSYVRHVAKAAKLRVILWTIDPRDWSRPGTSTIVRRVLAHVRPGAVILLHDGGGDRSQTVAALPQILAGLKARGYSAVTLSELYGLPEKHSTAGRWFFAVPRLAPKR